MKLHFWGFIKLVEFNYYQSSNMDNEIVIIKW